MAKAAVRNQPNPVFPASGGGAWLSMLAPATRLVLHGNGDVQMAAASVWGTPFSEQACRASVAGARAALWQGPDEYLLLGPASDSEPAILTTLERALDALPHALVDVSHRQIAMQLRGPHATTILNGGCPLDLDLDAFPVGMCTRTVFSKADIVLWRIAEDVFHVEVWRSFTSYLTGLLLEIGREFITAV